MAKEMAWKNLRSLSSMKQMGGRKKEMRKKRLILYMRKFCPSCVSFVYRNKNRL